GWYQVGPKLASTRPPGLSAACIWCRISAGSPKCSKASIDTTASNFASGGRPLTNDTFGIRSLSAPSLARARLGSLMSSPTTWRAFVASAMDSRPVPHPKSRIVRPSRPSKKGWMYRSSLASPAGLGVCCSLGQNRQRARYCRSANIDDALKLYSGRLPEHANQSQRELTVRRDRDPCPVIDADP